MKASYFSRCVAILACASITAGQTGGIAEDATVSADNPGPQTIQLLVVYFSLTGSTRLMMNNRMVVAGPLYQDEEGEDIWGEPGAAAMTGPLDPGVSEDELDGARRLEERLARLAQRLRGK